MNNVSNFSWTLKIIRKEKKLTQSVVAERCNLSVNYIGRIERGISIPTFKIFIVLCNSLEVWMTDFAKKMDNVNYVGNDYVFLDSEMLRKKIKTSRLLLCNYLLEIRKQNKITQISFAEKLQINKTYYGFIERNVSNPTIGKIINICNSLNISFYDLLLSIEKNGIS